MAEVQENAAAPEVQGKGKHAVNGDSEQKENGHAEEPAENGHDAPAEEKEPPVKKVKKVSKEKSGNRRSSSRLTNIASGTKLSSEINSDNLPKGC